MQGPTRVATCARAHIGDSHGRPCAPSLVHPSPCESYDYLHFIDEETKPAEKGDSLSKITQ